MIAKRPLCRLLCALMCALYLLSITGVDVHFDSHNGRTYVVSLLQGISCDDIHAEDRCGCHHGHGCNHENGICHAENDCTDDISVLETDCDNVQGTIKAPVQAPSSGPACIFASLPVRKRADFTRTDSPRRIPPHISAQLRI